MQPPQTAERFPPYATTRDETLVNGDPPFGQVTRRVRYMAERPELPGPLYRAYMRCLHRQELIAITWWLVDRHFEERAFHAELLGPLLEEEFATEEAGLVEWLSFVVRDSSYRRRLRAAYYIQLLGHCFPSELRKKLLKQLLDSSHAGIRARGLRQLRAHWDNAFAGHVGRIWQEQQDRESAKLVIEQFDEEFLVREFDSLCEVVPASGHFHQLSMRVAAVQRGMADRIRKCDPVTFLYVMGELGKDVPETVARDIYLRHRDSYRAGVILWAIGKLEHWDLLREIEECEADKVTPIWRSF